MEDISTLLGINYQDIYANAYAKAMTATGGSTGEKNDLFDQICKKYEGEQKILDSLYQVLDNIYDESSPSAVEKNKNKQYSLLEDTDTLFEMYYTQMLQNSRDARNKGIV